MKKLIAIAFLIFIFLIIKDGPDKPKDISSIMPPPPILDSFKLWALVQNWRMSQNLQTYIKDEKLCNLAKERLPEVKIDWSHKRFWNHLNEFSYLKLGENLAEEYSNEQFLLDQWLNSPEHRENLNFPYKYSCIETDGTYAVQIFANF